MDVQLNQHHYVFGTLNDFLSGKELPDTLDERYRQKIVKLIVQENNFHKTDVKRSIEHIIKAGKKKAIIKCDYEITYNNKIICMIKYAPGSLVTRRLSTLAFSRAIVSYQIPFVVITNGEDAEILDGESGKIINTGLSNLPRFEQVSELFSSFSFKPIDKMKQEQASRIVYACEIDGACPCDTDICTLES